MTCRFRSVEVTIAGFGFSSGVVCVARDGCAVRTMVAGLFCGTTLGRLSLQGFALRTIAVVGSSFFATAGFRFGVTTAGPNANRCPQAEFVSAALEPS
jgi:hypothetical protein